MSVKEAQFIDREEIKFILCNLFLFVKLSNMCICISSIFTHEHFLFSSSSVMIDQNWILIDGEESVRIVFLFLMICVIDTTNGHLHKCQRQKNDDDEFFDFFFFFIIVCSFSSED